MYGPPSGWPLPVMDDINPLAHLPAELVADMSLDERLHYLAYAPEEPRFQPEPPHRWN